MREKFQKFLVGRYGTDKLAKFLNVLIIITLILSLFLKPFIYLCLLLIIYNYFRVFSRKIYKRSRENQIFLKIISPATKRFSIYKRRIAERKTHRFYRCPSCRCTLRVPKGKGRIMITCPKCKMKFEKKAR